MLLSDEERFSIVLNTIREHQNGINDIPMIIVDKVCKQVIQSVNKQIDTQEIYDEVVECFNFYNDLVKEKNLSDLPIIEDEFYDLVEVFLNDVIKEVF